MEPTERAALAGGSQMESIYGRQAKPAANEPRIDLGPAVNRHWWNGFAVEGIQWRRFVDWAIEHLPAPLHPLLIWAGTLLFFLIAAPARTCVVRQLAIVLPNSGRFVNYFRAMQVFANFGWMLRDAAMHRLRHTTFGFEIEGEQFLQQLGSSVGAIVLTAHMGNYDLGAAMFAKRFNRQLRMVRAPERDALTAQHVGGALQQDGGVKVEYSDHGMTLAFDLLNALRQHEMISIQGDRVMGELARAPVRFFGREVSLPTGPFVLSLAAETPIYPLFIIRAGFRKYKVVAYEPIQMDRSGHSRDEQIARAMARWSSVLEDVIRHNWSQWYAFKRLF